MPMTAQEIADHALILPVIKQQSAMMQQTYAASPRMSSVFATQQRWLLAHAAMALLFRATASGKPPFTMSRFLALVAEHAISSRNTADAFVKEMLHYGHMELREETSDRRSQPMTLAKHALEGIIGWVAMHLTTLDTLDGGQRLEFFMATEDAIFQLQPEIADGLLTDQTIRQPRETFSLFTWLNNGGVIMDWLITGLGDLSADGRRYPTSVASVADMAVWLKLSRTHLARKLAEAEKMGSLGWSGHRGDSALWVSAGFVREIIEAQAAKLSVIDTAFERCFGRQPQANFLELQ